MIQLRDTVKDSITGFTGIVISRCEWINGCVRIGVQSPKLKDGVPTEPQHFDEPQLILVKRAEAEKVKPRGGPRKDIRSHEIPKRPGF